MVLHHLRKNFNKPCPVQNQSRLFQFYFYKVNSFYSLPPKINYTTFGIPFILCFVMKGTSHIWSSWFLIFELPNLEF